jgi:hypothetical protein
LEQTKTQTPYQVTNSSVAVEGEEASALDVVVILMFVALFLSLLGGVGWLCYTQYKQNHLLHVLAENAALQSELQLKRGPCRQESSDVRTLEANKR